MRIAHFIRASREDKPSTGGASSPLLLLCDIRAAHVHRLPVSEMIKAEASLDESLADVAGLSKAQLQKELAAAVRYSQGTSRASWKKDKAPNWWTEGAVVNSHGVAGHVAAFATPKTLSLECLQAALAQFYLSRIYFESHLKDVISGDDLEDVAEGKNPYPEEHYAGSGIAAIPQEDVDVEDEDADDEEVNNEKAKDKVEPEEGSDEDVKAEPELAVPSQTESLDESHVSERATEEDTVVDDDPGEKDSEEEELNKSKAKHYDLDELEKFFKKLRKRKLDFRVKKLSEVWELAMEDQWFVQNAWRRDIGSWMKRMALEIGIARAWHSLEMFERKTREQLKRENNQLDIICQMKQHRIPSAMLNVPLKNWGSSMSSLVQSTAAEPPAGGMAAGMRTPMAGGATTLRRSRRAAAQASSVKTQQLMQGTPMRTARPGEHLVEEMVPMMVPMLVSVNGSPVETGTSGENAVGMTPIGAVAFRNNDLADLSTLIAAADDPDALKRTLMATARKAVPKTNRR